MTTHEAFRDLISRRGWYKLVGINVKTAGDAKRRFIGKSETGISVETMEKYLAAAGYTVLSEKTWEKV